VQVPDDAVGFDWLVGHFLTDLSRSGSKRCPVHLRHTERKSQFQAAAHFQACAASALRRSVSLQRRCQDSLASGPWKPGRGQPGQSPKGPVLSRSWAFLGTSRYAFCGRARHRRRRCGAGAWRVFRSIGVVIASTAKQSIGRRALCDLDCFASLAMTGRARLVGTCSLELHFRRLRRLRRPAGRLGRPAESYTLTH
jgi:hypothetical protein